MVLPSFFVPVRSPNAFGGVNYSGVWLDEASLMKEEVHGICIATLRENKNLGWMSATFTPRGKLHWTYTVFGNEKTRTPNTILVHAKTSENPFLHKDFAGLIRSQLTSLMAEQELDGFFVEQGDSLIKENWLRFADSSPVDAKRVRFWDTACLIAGTKITTKRGEIPIENVRVGDYVLTRQGFKRVRKSWLTKYVNEVTTVKFSNGNSLTGTADHRVWTQNRGWVEMGELKLTDQVIFSKGERVCQDVGQPQKKTLKRLSSTEYVTPKGRGNFTTKQTDGIRCESVPMPKPFTKPFGNFIMGKYPPDTTFTILTGMPKITIFPICNSCCQASIDVFTNLLKATTEPKNTNLILLNASKPENEVSRREITFAQGVEQSLYQGHTNPRNTVPDVVENEQEQKIPVYDLEVEDAHEFFANGVLVHNSTVGGCYTAGVLVAKDANGKYWIEDVERFKYTTAQRNERIKQVAIEDRQRGFVKQYAEIQAGGGGIDSFYALEQYLLQDGISIEGIPTGNKSKSERAKPLQALAEHEKVWILKRSWTQNFVLELVNFPQIVDKDQVDAVAGAVNKLLPEEFYIPYETIQKPLPFGRPELPKVF